MLSLFNKPVSPGFIISDSSAIIWGVGATEADAWADAMAGAAAAGESLAVSECYAYPATAELIRHVKCSGGDCAWTTRPCDGAHMADVSR